MCVGGGRGSVCTPTDCLASTSEVSDVCESVDSMTNHRQTNNQWILSDMEKFDNEG